MGKIITISIMMKLIIIINNYLIDLTLFEDNYKDSETVNIREDNIDYNKMIKFKKEEREIIIINTKTNIMLIFINI